MTACSTDWVFKGVALEKENVPFLGRNLPFFRYRDERMVDGFLPNVPRPAPPEFVEPVNERLASWFAGCPETLSNAQDRLIVEDRRIRPAAYLSGTSGSIMYRTYPYDTFLADSRVAACYSRTHPDWKLNRELWGKAAAILCVGAGKIVDANYGWRVNAPTFEKAFVFAAGWVGRRLRTRKTITTTGDDRAPSSGSWPELGWYALHSKTLRDMWESASSEERSRMEAICGFDPWRISLSKWANEGFLLFRLLTLLCHWRETVDRRKRAGLPERLTTQRSTQSRTVGSSRSCTKNAAAS